MHVAGSAGRCVGPCGVVTGQGAWRRRDGGRAGGKGSGPNHSSAFPPADGETPLLCLFMCLCSALLSLTHAFGRSSFFLSFFVHVSLQCSAFLCVALLVL